MPVASTLARSLRVRPCRLVPRTSISIRFPKLVSRPQIKVKVYSVCDTLRPEGAWEERVRVD